MSKLTGEGLSEAAIFALTFGRIEGRARVRTAQLTVTVAR